jgi:hypothetical protein
MTCCARPSLGSIPNTNVRDGQSRHFDSAPLTSGLPRLADILRDRRYVSNVPFSDFDAHVNGLRKGEYGI